MLLNQVWGFLDGMHYVLDGVPGMLVHNIRVVRYPRAEVYESLCHIPSEEGMETEAYQKVKGDLGDDYETDLSNSIERYCAIALELGYVG